ncbi:MAG: hypothetical protein H5U02_11375 [Clostridia bacterium]|nr:hypothetical protein [Clostridia bacterium]
MGELLLKLALVFGPGVLSWGILIGGSYWFIRRGYAKLKARWKVSRGWTAAFLALWFLTATFALAYFDLNKLVYLKVERIPHLRAALADLGYERTLMGLGMPDPKYHHYSFHVQKPDQGHWVIVDIYLPPRNRIEEVPPDIGERRDLISSTGSARLYYDWNPREQAYVKAIVETPGRVYMVGSAAKNPESYRDLCNVLMRGEFSDIGWTREARTYWYAEASFFRWLSAYCSHHGDGILDVPMALLPLSAMLWAPVIALLPAGVFTFLPLWLWLVAFLMASILVTLRWLKVTKVDKGENGS